VRTSRRTIAQAVSRSAPDAELLARARQFLRKRQTEQALVLYRRVLTSTPGSLDAQLGLAEGELVWASFYSYRAPAGLGRMEWRMRPARVDGFTRRGTDGRLAAGNADETSGAWAIRPPMPRHDFADRELA
jgi:hypothetical protein